MTVIGETHERFTITVPEHDEEAIEIAWGLATDVGHKRDHNEDSLVANGTLFAVADGMGGHTAGDIASHAVVSRLNELEDGGFVEPESIIHALRTATIDIAEAIGENELGAGTTVTGAALTLRESHPYWVVFNVGDSRLYLFEHKVMTQVTVDHSVVQELVTAGLISVNDAEHHPDSNVVTRAVGFSAEPAPDFWLLPVTSNSRILLCSDGLTREVSDYNIRAHLAAGLGPQKTAEALIAEALESGGRDNVTAIVVDVLTSRSDSPSGMLVAEDTSPVP